MTRNHFKMRENADIYISPPFPFTILIEPTNVCNYKCEFCKNSIKKAKSAFLDFQLAKRIMEEAYLAGAREVGFYLNGEPLLHKELPEMVKFANLQGFSYIYITTNGSLATKELITKLSLNGLHSIKFSINSAERLEYTKIHGLDAYDIVMHNLVDAIEIRDNKIGSLHKVLASSVYTETTNKSALLRFEKEFATKLDDHALVEAENRFGKREEKANKYCKMIFNRAHITAHGYLTFCCSDVDYELLYADLNKEKFLDAWNNLKAQNFRKRFIERDLKNTKCDWCLNASAEPIIPLEL